MKATVYASYHQTAPRLSGKSLRPIHVGRAGKAPLPHMIGDDTGDSISERNAAWCELTALYWAWKNDHDSDYIGLMHYRRVLDVTDQAPSGPTEHFCDRFDAESWGTAADAWIDASLDEYDIVVPREHVMGRSVEDNYLRGHAPQDWSILREVIARDHPAFVDSFEAVAKGSRIRLGNMSIMSHAMFERYCDWLFSVLFTVEAWDVDRSQYSVYQGRYLGFLAERLMGVFLHYLQTHEPQVRIKEVAILNTSKALVIPYLTKQDAPDAQTVNIALSTDRAYLPHAAAMLRSVMDHADPARPINVFLLYSDVSADDLATLETMLRTRPATTLHPLNTGGWFNESYRSSSRAPSNATYNRFLLFSFLPGLDRLLYLDADMIALADVCALYDSDLGDAQIGAVPDWIMTRTLTGPVETIDPEVPDLAAYHRNTLGLSDGQIARYFNAGVLLFNFAAMKDPAGVGADLMKDAKQGRYLFRDQDILNRYFKDSYHMLDPRWNVFNSTDASYNKVPKDNHAIAMDARRDAWILHFADRAYKPWKDTAVPKSDLYWSTLIRTPFYAEVVRQGAGSSGQHRSAATGRVVQAGRTLAQKVPALRGPLLRIYGWTGRGR